MTDSNVVFGGSIPERYDRYMGPALFEPYARDLAARLPADAGRVLEIACGTGIVTRQLRARMRAGAHLVATDLSDAMIAFAKPRVPTGDRGASLEFKQADAAALPFPDASFDAVACQFGFMFLPDKAAGFREARRVLVPGGTLLFNVWDSFRFNPTARVAHETVRKLFPEDQRTFYTIPFGFFDVQEIRTLLDDAGFADASVHMVGLETHSPSARDLALGLVTGSPMYTSIVERGTVPVDQVVEAVTAGLAAAHGAAPLVAPMRAIVVSASAKA